MKNHFSFKNITLLTMLMASLCAVPNYSYSDDDTPKPEKAPEVEAAWPAKTYYRYQEVQGHKIFYREAGDPAKPTILLLHGFPSTSHEYRELIPLLSGRYHIIAPDYIGFGYSDHPDPDAQRYTFDMLSDYMVGFLQEMKITEYTMYMQDFGAPVGYRVMLREPGTLKGLIVQNANAYMEGLTQARQDFFLNAAEDRSTDGVNKLYDYVTRESVINKQYLRDVKGKEDTIDPDSWDSDLAFLQTDKDKKIMVQLFQDYENNLIAYPKWQDFLRLKKPPTLIVWGNKDPAFVPSGARAYLKDVPDAELHLIDAGHFVVEEKPAEIAKYIIDFMGRIYK